MSAELGLPEGYALRVIEGGNGWVTVRESDGVLLHFAHERYTAVMWAWRELVPEGYYISQSRICGGWRLFHACSRGPIHVDGEVCHYSPAEVVRVAHLDAAQLAVSDDISDRHAGPRWTVAGSGFASWASARSSVASDPEATDEQIQALRDSTKNESIREVCKVALDGGVRERRVCDALVAEGSS